MVERSKNVNNNNDLNADRADKTWLFIHVN
jgi:hypothetical protein